MYAAVRVYAFKHRRQSTMSRTFNPAVGLLVSSTQIIFYLFVFVPFLCTFAASIQQVSKIPYIRADRCYLYTIVLSRAGRSREGGGQKKKMLFENSKSQIFASICFNFV